MGGNADAYEKIVLALFEKYDENKLERVWPVKDFAHFFFLRRFKIQF